MTLVVVVLALVFGVLMASNAFVQLHFATHASDRLSARNLADSLTAATVAQIFGDATLGSNNTVLLGAASSDGGGQASLRFKTPATDAISGYYVPQSINNLGIDDPSAVTVTGWERPVPPGCADLVAESNYQSCHVLTEQILKHTGMFYSVATAGAATLDGVQIYAVASPSAVQRDASGKLVVDIARQQPSDLVSNDVSSDNPAVRLTNGTRISGDVEAVGAVYLKDSTVGGEIDDRTTPITLPNIRYSTLAAPFQAYSTTIPDTYTADAQLDTIVEAPKGLTVDGTLQLLDAVVLVDGDLKVTKGIEGHGAVLVSGSVDVAGSASITADTPMALLADGDVRILGASRDQSALTGLVYAGGTISAKHVSLFGCAIAAGNSTASFVDANLVAMPVDFTLTVTAPLAALAPVNGITESIRDPTVWDGGAYMMVALKVTASYRGDPYHDFWDAVNHQWRRPTVNDLVFQVSMSPPAPPSTQVVKSSWLQTIAPATGERGYSPPPNTPIDNDPAQVQRDVQKALDALYAWLQSLPLSPQRQSVPHTLTIDLNQFVGLEDTTRIIFCREQTAFVH